MDTIEKYNEWLINLPNDERDKFKFIQSIAIYYSPIRLWELFEQYSIRRQFYNNKFEDLESFAKDELYNASKELTQIPLFCGWDDMVEEIKRIKANYKKAGRKDEYFEHDYLEGKMHVFFRDIIYYRSPNGINLADEYYSQNIDVNSSYYVVYDIRKLKDFDKVIDIMARFQWLIIMFRNVESKSYNTEIEKPDWIPKPKFPPLPDCFSDMDYFINVILKNPKVSDLFTVDEKGLYYLKKNKKAYLGGLAVRLLNIGKLKYFIKTNQDLARVFCPFFHVEFNPVEEKQFQPDRAKTDLYSFIK
jgi:hypothetical protein